MHLNSDVQKIIGPNNQFVIHPSRFEDQQSIVLLVPGLWQNGSGLYYFFSEIYSNIKMDDGFPIMFDYINSGDSEIDWNTDSDSMTNYLLGIQNIIDYANYFGSKEIYVLLTGLSNVFLPNLQAYNPNLKFVCVPPFPKDVLTDYNAEQIPIKMDTNYLLKHMEGVTMFFESLGTSWAAWKGRIITRKFLNELIEATRHYVKVSNKRVYYVSEKFDHKDLYKIPNYPSNRAILSPSERGDLIRELKSLIRGNLI